MLDVGLPHSAVRSPLPSQWPGKHGYLQEEVRKMKERAHAIGEEMNHLASSFDDTS